MLGVREKVEQKFAYRIYDFLGVWRGMSQMGGILNKEIVGTGSE